MHAHTRLRRLRLLAHEDEEVAFYARQRFADEDLENDLDVEGKEVLDAVRQARLKRAKEDLKRPPHRQQANQHRGWGNRNCGRKRGRGGPSGGRAAAGGKSQG